MELSELCGARSRTQQLVCSRGFIHFFSLFLVPFHSVSYVRFTFFDNPTTIQFVVDVVGIVHVLRNVLSVLSSV